MNSFFKISCRHDSRMAYKANKEHVYLHDAFTAYISLSSANSWVVLGTSCDIFRFQFRPCLGKHLNTDRNIWRINKIQNTDFVSSTFDLASSRDLKTKIEKEDTKQELLSSQSNLTSTHCIRCLQPFKFLVNSKRQCLDCHFYVCKTCSRYSTKEHGWVCDPCRMSRSGFLGKKS